MPSKTWKVLKSEYKLKTPYLNVRYDRCESFRGNRVDYYVVERQPAVGIIAFTTERQLILERQYRHPAQEWIIEAPAGLMDKGPELARQTVKRELLEETGYQVKKIKHLIGLYASAGVLEHAFKLYIGFDAEKVAEPALDQSEDLEVMLMDLDQAIGMIKSKKIKDAETIVGIMLAQDYIKEHGYN